MSDAEMAQITELARLCADLLKSNKTLSSLSNSESLYEGEAGSRDITSAWNRAVTISLEAETAMQEKWKTMDFVPQGAQTQMREAIESAKTFRERQPSVVTWQSLQRSEE